MSAVRTALFALSLITLHTTSTRPACAQDATPQAARDTSAAAPEPAAHDEEARALFAAGRAAFAEGRYDEALTRFVRAHELSGRPQLLYNIGVSADRLRRDEDALRAFRAYVEAVPEADNHAEIVARIAILERELAARTSASTPTSAVPAATARARLARRAPLPDAEDPRRRAHDETGLHLAVAGGVTTGLALVSAAIAGGLALSLDTRLTAECGTACPEARLDELFTLTVITDASFGLAFVGATLFAIGLGLELGGEGGVEVAIAPTPGGVTLAMAGAL